MEKQVGSRKRRLQYNLTDEETPLDLGKGPSSDEETRHPTLDVTVFWCSCSSGPTSETPTGSSGEFTGQRPGRMRRNGMSGVTVVRGQGVSQDYTGETV